MLQPFHQLELELVENVFQFLQKAKQMLHQLNDEFLELDEMIY
jgi:hypothetical protein